MIFCLQSYNYFLIRGNFPLISSNFPSLFDIFLLLAIKLASLFKRTTNYFLTFVIVLRHNVFSVKRAIRT